MVKGKFGKVAVAFALAAVCALGMVACGGAKASSTAATVNGTAISEDEITNYIQNVRAQIGYTDNDSWAMYLTLVNMTPETLRENILNSLIEQELIKQYANEKGVEVSDDDIQYYVDRMKGKYKSDADWEAALKDAGLTEEEYRESIKSSLLTQKLNEVFQNEAQVPEETLLSTAQSYAAYIDGSKRSSHILFSLDDQELAQSVLDRIKSGELDFADAAKQYSIDGSADNGGDVGWDATSSFVTEYQSALDGLEVGEMSGLVESQFGYHIIKCTDYFVAPETITSLDQIPEDFRDVIESAASTTAVDEAFGAWLDEVRAKANIVINDMPADVPYNVALAAAEGSESAESASAESTSAESASASASSSSAS